MTATTDVTSAMAMARKIVEWQGDRADSQKAVGGFQLLLVGEQAQGLSDADAFDEVVRLLEEARHDTAGGPS